MTYHHILEFHGQWRSYQQRVLDHFDQYIKDQKIHIVAAPGSGKTTLGIELIRRIDQPALVLVPSIAIKEQWVTRITEAFLNVECYQNDYISQDLRYPKLITVSTYQALHSAMNHYIGTIVETNNELKVTEDVDYHDFDLVSTLQKYHVGTICLDECHHLRSEWWKSLEKLKKSFSPVFTIALTATPPYDSSLHSWMRYMDMCGEIDEEITVPELVKDGTLCPHQDYVYLNYPTQKEKQQITIFEQNAQTLCHKLCHNQQFLAIIQTHRFFVDHVLDEELLEKPAYLSSLLILLHENDIAYPVRYQKLLGFKKLEKMSLKWLEILLQGFLYDDIDSYRCEENDREELIKYMKSKGLIEKKQVTLQRSPAIEKLLIHSKGKCESIKSITFHEYQSLQDDLRLLILTDYIRKEYERTLGDETNDVSSLGVLPFFEQLRREIVRKKQPIQLGVLCGSIIIIPFQAKEEIINRVGADHVSFQKVGHLTDYVKVIGNQHILIQAVNELFTKGHIHVLIGTKSLLGEGWDSPCVNTLILASFVGSFMLSNQMRGRAMRVMKDNPDKTSNIWHLVCVKPKTSLLDDFDVGESEDFYTLARRMENFLGLHYQEETIENGMERLSFIEPPFSPQKVKKINHNMLKLSSNRNLLMNRWERALAIYDEIEIVDETEIKPEMITAVLLNDVLRRLLVIIISMLVGAIFLFPYLYTFSWQNIFAYVCGVLYFGSFLSVVAFYSKKILTLANPLGRLKQFGEGIKSALIQTNQLESLNCKVKTYMQAGYHVIYLAGGTGHDKALFATCVSQFFDPIDNQRYILCHPRKRKGLDCYFAVPECFAKRKEDAQLFGKYMASFIGKYRVIYTRNETGRKILLNARIRALANQEERCLSKRKVKGALE